MINRGNNTKRDFDKMAGDLLEEIHAASVLVDIEGRNIGWAPEDAIPRLHRLALTVGRFVRMIRNGAI